MLPQITGDYSCPSAAAPVESVYEQRDQKPSNRHLLTSMCVLAESELTAQEVHQGNASRKQFGKCSMLLSTGVQLTPFDHVHYRCRNSTCASHHMWGLLC